LKQILEAKTYNQKKFKRFKLLDNFRRFKLYNWYFIEKAFKMIKNKEYIDLNRYVQFYVYSKREKNLAIASEGTINFTPTY
jgi:hypothetical protein